ncbi:phage integrase SAM-like domain-containing protein [Hymenobacter lapidiphilus]|uniref:phage integrase SAM-like domain-containing protein n=1 Tax=Hymenobacter sp. CCM 8763 TaxID=2303334 RepID=UPI0011C1B6C6|nr:phage integrase SAM-like domain-containing protein [Hymenobacter sp. CCM 8763]
MSELLVSCVSSYLCVLATGQASYNTKMASIAFRIDTVNKRKAEQPVMVRYSHNKTSFVLSTEVSVLPSQFKNGKIVNHDNATGLNRKLSLVNDRIEYALDNVTKQKVEPLAPLVKEEYKRLLNSIAAIESVGGKEGIDKVYDIIELSDIEELENNILEHRSAITILESQIEVIKRKRNEWVSDLLSEYVKEHPLRKGKTLSVSTIRIFKSISNLLIKFNPELKITEVTDKTLYQFQDFMISEGKVNGTIEKYIGKIKEVLNYQKDRLTLTNYYKDYSFELESKEDNIIALEESDIKSLLELKFNVGRNLDKPSYEKTRDMFVLMCSTGLRFVDIALTPDKIKNNQIVLTPIKTRKKNIKVFIPLNPISKAILKKYDYNIPKMQDNYFTENLAIIAQRVPALHRKEVVTNISGSTITAKEFDKDGNPVAQPIYKLMKSHSGRRTFINICIDYNVKPITIMGMSGHTDIAQLNTYADTRRELRQREGKREVLNLLDLPASIEGV